MFYCDGKEIFATATLAKRIEKEMNRRGNMKFQTYRCSKCNNWHIGSNQGVVGADAHRRKIARKASNVKSEYREKQ